MSMTPFYWIGLILLILGLGISTYALSVETDNPISDMDTHKPIPQINNTIPNETLVNMTNLTVQSETLNATMTIAFCLGGVGGSSEFRGCPIGTIETFDRCMQICVAIPPIWNITIDNQTFDCWTDKLGDCKHR